MKSKIGGWMYDQELDWLHRNARGLAVEIGSYKGRSASVMTGVSLLICVDNWIWDNGPKRYEEFLKHRDTWPHRVVAFRQTSLVAAKGFKNRSLDFVFIDSDHRYEPVKADIAAWYPKVKKGGIISGHDYTPGWPGTVRAVDEKFKAQRQVCQTIWWVRV